MPFLFRLLPPVLVSQTDLNCGHDYYDFITLASICH